MILVVNADDGGVDVPRNRGIIRAAREGIVRSASLLVTFAAARDLVEQARCVPGLGIGLHLNLTEGMPITPGHKTFTGPDGRFLGKRELYRRAAAGLLDVSEARREIEAQWLRLETLGVRPDHLDGHNHAHLFPGISDAIAQSIPAGTWIRRPAFSVGEPRRDARDLPPDPYAGGEVLARALSALSGGLESRGWKCFRHASRFEGLLLPAGYSAADLIATLERIVHSNPEERAVCELMTHPGEACDRSVPFSASIHRPSEVDALTDPAVKAFIERSGIRLMSFGDLP